MNRNITREFITLFGINIDILDLRGLIEKVDTYVSNNTRAKIMYANVHTINLAYRDKEHMEAMYNADLVYCDGEGVRWGAKVLGKSLPQRMTGADWIWDLCEMCEGKGYSIYLLGGENGVAEEAARKLNGEFPNLMIAGTYHGYFPKYGEESDRVVATISNKKPDILLVGFGSPLQERWIHSNFEKLNTKVVWAMGAVMDFVSEKVVRGPRWMLDNGMEWLFRLIVEPGRMWKRYVIGNLVFLKRIIREKFSEINHNL